MLVDGGDVVVICLDNSLFGLHQLYRIRDTLAEAVAGLFQSLMRQIEIAFRNFNLIGRGVQVNERLAHVLIDLAAQVFELCLPLAKYGSCLVDIPRMRPPSQIGIVSVPDTVQTLSASVVGRSPATP